MFSESIPFSLLSMTMVVDFISRFLRTLVKTFESQERNNWKWRSLIFSKLQSLVSVRVKKGFCVHHFSQSSSAEFPDASAVLHVTGQVYFLPRGQKMATLFRASWRWIESTDLVIENCQISHFDLKMQNWKLFFAGEKFVTESVCRFLSRLFRLWKMS